MLKWVSVKSGTGGCYVFIYFFIYLFFNSWLCASWFNVNKRSNLMQQYTDIYSLQSHSTRFGCHSAHHQEY